MKKLVNSLDPFDGSRLVFEREMKDEREIWAEGKSIQTDETCPKSDPQRTIVYS